MPKVTVNLVWPRVLPCVAKHVTMKVIRVPMSSIQIVASKHIVAQMQWDSLHSLLQLDLFHFTG